jgi:hypothetical protein
MNQVWAILWRLGASVVLVVVAWTLLLMLARLTGRSFDGPTLLGYLLGGVVLAAGVWGLGWIWHPYFRRPPPQPDIAE